MDWGSDVDHLLQRFVSYRKIPKISPSKYKPLKPVTQKTLREYRLGRSYTQLLCTSTL